MLLCSCCTFFSFILNRFLLGSKVDADRWVQQLYLCFIVEIMLFFCIVLWCVMPRCIILLSHIHGKWTAGTYFHLVLCPIHCYHLYELPVGVFGSWVLCLNCTSLFVRFLCQYKDVYETDLKCEVKILHSSGNMGAQSQLSPTRETEVRHGDNSSCAI